MAFSSSDSPATPAHTRPLYRLNADSFKQQNSMPFIRVQRNTTPRYKNHPFYQKKNQTDALLRHTPESASASRPRVETTIYKLDQQPGRSTSPVLFLSLAFQIVSLLFSLRHFPHCGGPRKSNGHSGIDDVQLLLFLHGHTSSLRLYVYALAFASSSASSRQLVSCVLSSKPQAETK